MAGTIESRGKTHEGEAASNQPSISSSVDTATLELLARWRLEDATESPELVRAAEQELRDFEQAMNESRMMQGIQV